MYNEYIGKYSPFSNNSPTQYDTFIGRKKTIKNILKEITKVKEGNPQHYFLTSNKGYGKTSLTFYLEELLSNKIYTVYVSGKNNDSLEHLCVEIIETLLNIFPQNTANKIKTNLIGEQITGNDLVKYSDDIIKYFPSYLEYICKYLPRNLLLIIEDIDELLKEKVFINWYINLIKEIKENNYKIPVFLLLTSLKNNYQNTEEKFKKLFPHQNLERLSDDEVEEFFKKSLESVEMTIDSEEWDEDYSYLIHYTSGIPWLMQEIGENIFQHAHYKEKITQRDINEGLLDTSQTIYYKEIQELYEKHFQDPVFDKIFKKLLTIISLDKFRKEDLEKLLSIDEIIFLEEYLKKAEKLEIIKLENSKYSFNNPLYTMYFESLKE